LLPGKTLILFCSFQVITAKLWDGLGRMQPVYHLRCVALLYQFHNLVPNPRTIERILARSLERSGCNDGESQESSATTDAYQRFTLLWHLSRDLDTKGAKRRNFDICLLKMLDNLNLSSGPLRALSQSWLIHAMARGDIARLMEPLFITLLDPSTARVSVLHAKVELLEAGGVDDLADIFSIATSEREVIYHVSGAPEKKGNRADQNKRIFALNKFRQRRNECDVAESGAESMESASAAHGKAKQPELNSVPLSVNPFALVPPEVAEYDFYSRGYAPTTRLAADTSSSSEDADSDTDTEDGSLPKTTQSTFGDSMAKSVAGDSVCSSTFTQKDASLARSMSNDSVSRSLSIHPLHSHLLLYCQVSDSRQILYTMECIKNILRTNPRLAICTLSTTNLNSGGGGGCGGGGGGSSGSSGRSNQIQMLLARHRKSVFGKNFVGSVPNENMVTYRNATLIEVLLSTLLYYLRSYYPNLAQVRLSEEEIKANREVQLMAIDILYLLVAELVSVVQDNGRAYATYIADLFSRCKVQKVVLHSLLAGINDMRDSPKRREEAEKMAFTEDILRFNEVYSNQVGVSASERISNYSEAFQVQVLRLLLSLVMLEQAINHQRSSAGEPTDHRPKSDSSKPVSGSTYNSSTLLRYHNDHVIPDQPMFLAAMVSALRQDKMRHLHSHWTSLITSTLPFLGKSLSQTVLEVTAQLSRNLENLAPFYSASDFSNGYGEREDEAEVKTRSTFGFIPADYVVTQLEALTLIYHYCLLDSSNNQAVTASFSLSATTTSQTSAAAALAIKENSSLAGGEILTNLLHVFLSNTETNALAARSLSSATSTDTMAIARKILLSTLPRLVNTCAVLWKNLNVGERAESRKGAAESASILVGSPKTVRAKLLDMLSPIAKNHSVHFLSAVGVVWQERKPTISPAAAAAGFPALPTCGDNQRVLVELCGSIRSLPVTAVIATVRQVLKTPPNVSAAVVAAGSGTALATKASVEVSVLQFFYAYLAKCSSAQVFESWSSLAGLLRDCLALAPPAIFLALSIVNQFVHRSPSALSDRKDQKELQVRKDDESHLERLFGISSLYATGYNRSSRGCMRANWRRLSRTDNMAEEES
jgi:hypothetical protein